MSTHPRQSARVRCTAAFSTVATVVAVAIVAIVAVAGAAAAAEPSSEPFRSPRTEVRLVAEDASIRPGEPFRVGLHFRLAEEWHVYWRNPGDSGTAPSVAWSLPDGWSAGTIAWPYPESIPVGPFVNYGYEEEVLLPVTIRPRAPAPGADPVLDAADDADLHGNVRIEAQASWLVCKVDCIPEQATFVLELPLVEALPEPSHWTEEFNAADARMPVDLPGLTATVAETDDGSVRLEVAHPPDLDLEGAEIEFFPADPAAIEHAAEPRIERGPRRVALTLQRSPFATGAIETLDGVLVVRSAAPQAGGPVALRVSAGPATETTDAAASAMAPAAPSAGRPGIAAALGLAFLGGLLLNLMPCVFPVISIKILGLLGHGGDRAAGRRHGLLFAAGIVVSFWILAGLLLALRAAGERIGWGFQLQSPLFLGLLALLFFTLGLNFLGVFEIGTGLAGLAGRAGGATRASGPFLHGMLAVLVATPCTAPFMGTALGFALVVPAATAMLVFTALGLGMAAPYVGLVLFPRALDLLPRPGPWMETLKQLMAFPLFATVVWMVWVLAAQRGPGGVAAVLAALLLVGFAAWIGGRLAAGGTPARRTAAGVAIALLAAAAIWLVVPGSAPAATLSAGAKAGPAAGAAGAVGTEWIEWSPATVERLRAEGRPVYVDFTARWCITCQVNKKVVFGSDRVLRAFEERDVALVRADWTSQDPRITDALERFGRSGVPLNVYYPPGAASEPQVLPTVLSPGIVLETLSNPTQGG